MIPEKQSTKFGKNYIFYNWAMGCMPLEEVIDDINKRLCEFRDDDKINTNYELLISIIKSQTQILKEFKKLKDIIKQELKINLADYEYQTETKLIRKKGINQ